MKLMKINPNVQIPKTKFVNINSYNTVNSLASELEEKDTTAKQKGEK